MATKQKVARGDLAVLHGFHIEDERIEAGEPVPDELDDKQIEELVRQGVLGKPEPPEEEKKQKKPPAKKKQPSPQASKQAVEAMLDKGGEG